MAEMTKRERVETLLEGGKPDRVPNWQFTGIAASKIYGYQWKDIRENPKLAVETELRYGKESGTDILSHTCIECNAPVIDLGVNVKYFDDNYLNIMDHYYVEPEDVDKKEFYDASDRKQCPHLWKYLLDELILLAQSTDEYRIHAQTWGPMTVAGNLRGVETLMMDFMLEPEMAQKIMDNSTAFIDDIVAQAFKGGCEDLLLGDPTSSGSLISKEIFEEFSIPKINQLARKYRKEYNAPSHLHICGEAAPIAESVNKAEVDVYTFDYMNNLKDMANWVSDKIILAGNIDPMNVIWMGSPELVDEKCREAIEAMKDRRFILMTGCETPRDTPLANLQAMASAAKKYGTY